MSDIYFDADYGKLYEKHEQGKSEVFELNSQYGTIRNVFIKREIPSEIKGEKYYDIITPYGYGGPIITDCVEANKENLLAEYQKEFSMYCMKNNIVSEFVRFHPMVDNAEDFNDIYNTTHIRNTVGTNLRDYEDPFQEEFSKSCRKNIRKSLKSDVSFKITEKPNDVKKFMDVYYSTMERNNATEFYYFDETYFNQCIKYFKENLLVVEAIYEDTTIAMGFYFIYKDYIHIHLSGTLTEYLRLSPAYVLRYAVTQWGKENGYHMIHHGGGRTNDSEDSLYKFKKQFGKNTEFEFHIGKKIWNEATYNELCESKNIDRNVEYFPAYRYEPNEVLLKQ